MFAEQLANFIIELGDFWTLMVILGFIVVIIAVAFIAAKRVKPTDETPAAFTEFVKTCLAAVEDSQLTSAEKLAVAKKGAQLLSTFTLEK